ncbi:MAG: T9SS type A sorting domain-containing protein [Flavobacteriales bacterium]|nr:T9SS type A sorting domain-containing protein [Flavobacteriales bacterium]
MKKTVTFRTTLFLIGFCTIFFPTSFYGQHQIGHTTITFQDTNRGNRNIETEIYYPAQSAGDDVTAIQDTFPVIVFGHGFVMAWDAYQNVWEEFVPQGYIMVFPRTEGNILSTDHQEFGWDLQFLVNQIQVEGATPTSLLYDVVAPETALMGHSMGGGAAFLAADSLVSNGNINLRTLVGLAPAESSTNGVSSINSAKSITVPSVIFSGSQDGVAPPVDHHIPMYDSLASSCKTFISITGGAHCYFANSNFACDFGEGTSSSGISITRAEQHDTYFDFLTLWLDYTLRYNCDAFTEFNDSLNTSTRVTNNQACIQNPTPTIVDNAGTLTSSVSGVSYIWYLNGSPIASSNQISIVVTLPGLYEVEVFFNDGCSEISAPYNVITTGIEHFNTDNFQFYPNPTNSTITVEGVNSEELKKIKIYDILGQGVYSFQIIGNEIDVSSFSKGIYFIQSKNSLKKLIVE